MSTKKLFFKALFLLIFITGNKIFSQASLSVDNAFDAGSGFYRSVNGLSASVQPDDKIVITGFFDFYNRSANRYVVRLKADGTLDDTFNASAAINFPIFNGLIKVLSTGKILIAGTNPMTNQGFITRLESTGAADTTFTSATFSSNSWMTSVDELPDGRIILGGNFTTINGLSQKGVVLLNINGTVDSSFDISSALPTNFNTSYTYTVFSQSEGKILISGTFKQTLGGPDIQKLVRYNTNATLDSQFNERNGIVRSITKRNDGKLIVSGSIYNINNSVFTQGVLLLNEDGTADTNFNTGNSGASGYVENVKLISGGKMVIQGSFTSYNGVNVSGNLALLKEDGTLDTSFNAGTGINTTNLMLNAQSDGKIILSGWGGFTSYNGVPVNGFVRINTNGELDTTFNAGNVGAQSMGQIQSIMQLSDGNYIVSGSFSEVNGSPASSIVKLNADGSIGSNFTPNFGNGMMPRGFIELSNGKFMVFGTTTVNGTTINSGIAILNADGTLYSAVNPSNSFNSAGNIIKAVKDPTGKILVLGSLLSTTQGANIIGIYRLNEDGTLDTTFNQSNAGFNSSAMLSNIAVQPNGKIILAGDITSYNGTSKTKLIRLNADGTLDPSFDVGTGPNMSTLNVITPLSGGKIAISGSFSSYNGANRPGIAIINNDGSLDTGFNPSAGTNQGRPIFAMMATSDNSLLLAGSFTFFNSVATSGGFAKVALDGTVDTSFNTGNDGASGGSIMAILKQNDGKLMVGGGFQKFNGVSRKNLARLEVNGVSLGSKEIAVKKISLYPNPAKDFVTISNLAKGAEVSLFDLTGKLLYATKAFGATVTLNTSVYQNGMYLIKVDGQTTKLLITK